MVVVVMAGGEDVLGGDVLVVVVDVVVLWHGGCTPAGEWSKSVPGALTTIDHVCGTVCVHVLEPLSVVPKLGSE
jgi:hypothetical protein